MNYVITGSKFIGVGSIGLLAANLFNDVYDTIPELINSLNHQVNIQKGNYIVKKVVNALISQDICTKAFTILSTALLSSAYWFSGVGSKHPYLLYSAAVSPITLILLSYQNSSQRASLNDKLSVLSKFEEETTKKESPDSTVNPGTYAEIAAAAAPQPDSTSTTTNDEDSLSRSYIHVSDEEESCTTSTPSTGSPIATATENNLQSEVSVEEEVQVALLKREIAYDLDKIKYGYFMGAGVAGLGFIVATVGLIGEFYLF